MKPKWITVLLVVSLVGNALELGLYARAKWQRHRAMEKFYQSVQSGAGQWNQRVVVPDFEPRMQALKLRQIRWRSELHWQDYQNPPDTAIDRLALDSVASITRQICKLMYESRRALPTVADSNLRKRMERRWRQQMDIEN